MTTARLPLKDQLFHRGNVARIAAEIAAVDPRFDAACFTDLVVGRFDELELKQRIDWIAECLADHLPGDFRRAIGILLDSLPPPCDPDRHDGDFGDFIYAPYSRFVAVHGCSPADLELSLAALREITMRFSAEDAIRSFLNTYPDRTVGALVSWCDDPHYHVRRLCSEGTRPRLPWAARLTIPPTAALPILDALYPDPTRFVTRSVANHVNDIGKDDPDLALDLLERWRTERRQRPQEMEYVVRHATRSLVKRGDVRALRLIGVAADVDVDVARLACSPQVELGEVLQVSFTVTTPEDADLVIDYAITFPGPTGRTGRKVYKLRRVRTSAGEPVDVRHRHVLRAGMTTRRIVPGVHHLELQINGRSAGKVSFEVVAPGGIAVAAMASPTPN